MNEKIGKKKKEREKKTAKHSSARPVRRLPRFYHVDVINCVLFRRLVVILYMSEQPTLRAGMDWVSWYHTVRSTMACST